MIIYNYSKCPIRYCYLEEKSLLPKFKNFKFMYDFKCSAPDYSGITHGIYDSNTDILYFQYNFEKFKDNISDISNIKDIINEICKKLYSKTKIDGFNRFVY